MPDISEFLGTQSKTYIEPKKEQKIGIDISEFLGKESTTAKSFMPTLRKPAFPELLQQATLEAGKAVSGLFKPLEAKPIDVTKPYYPEPSTTFRPSTEGFKGTPQLKPGLSITEEGLPVQQLKEGIEPSVTPVDDLLDRYRQFVSNLPEGKKGLEWLAAKGDQFVLGIPLAINDLLSLPGEVISGKRTPEEASQILYQSFPEPVNNFLDVASYVASPLGTGQTEEQLKESVRESWKKVKTNPEASIFSVGMGLGAITNMIGFVGKMKGVTPTTRGMKIIEETIKEESPTIPNKSISFKTSLEAVGEKPQATIIGTGETKVRGLAKHIEEKAIESGLTKGFGDLPEYQTVNMKEQAGKVTELIKADYEKAKKIAMGTESAPKDVLPEALLVGVENQAIKSGDVTTLRDLALNSNLISEATTMGQRIRTLAERDPESLIGHIRDIAQKRMEAVKVRVKNIDQARQRLVDGIKVEIRKAAPTRQTWEQFIESIRC